MQLKMRRNLPLLPLLLAATLLLSGCSTMRSLVGMDPKPVSPDWKSLSLRAAADANNNSAVAVDLVLIKDASMVDSLMNMPASKWYATRADLQRTFPEGLTVYPFELVPSQTLRLDDRKWNGQKAWAAVVFAGYGNPGEHRARLMLNAGAYVVQLNAQGFAVSEVKPGAAQ
ncbi:type VI secretion system protein [Duganella sacchari]|uniref:Type VI secretion system protein n=1 Tax=Duganella sacchari TaxID=551987 RepID=A0A1M7PGR4_9BURK|nr:MULTISPECIES: hypothetical protein [Duganella]SHN16253.1 type VI secretion system protein [Duganella sacchari]